MKKNFHYYMVKNFQKKSYNKIYIIIIRYLKINYLKSKTCILQ